MLLRAIMGGGAARRDQFYTEGVPPLSSMPWAHGGGTISQDEAVRIAAIQMCVSLLADVVSTLPTGAYLKDGERRLPFDEPAWLRQPIPEDPNVTWQDHISQAMWSQELDGNIFTLALPDVNEVTALYNVNPQRVTIRKPGRFELTLDGGRETVGPDQMIHIARNRRPGALRGASPVEEAGTTFAMKRAADRFGERVFNQGIFLSGQMLLPGPAGPDVIKELTEQIAQQYAGTANAGKPGIFANGAKWEVPQLNLQQMQLIELHKWAKLEAAGLWRVPPYLIGVTDPGAMANASVEGQGIDLAKYSITPRTTRIEAGYRRLLGHPDAYLRMNVDGLQRGDFKTRWEGYQIGLQNKAYYVEDVWRMEDLDPARTGHLLETPNNNAPADGFGRRTAELEADRERRHAELLATVSQPQPAPHVEIHGAPVTVHPAAAPNVTIADGAIRSEIHPTEVHVTTPAVSVPVTVEPSPVQVDVHVPTPRSVTKTVERDAADRITRITEEPA